MRSEHQEFLRRHLQAFDSRGCLSSLSVRCDRAPLLPAGTIIHIISWHDNSAANKQNPNPDTWLGNGPTSIDEMNFAWVSLTYLEQKDFERKVQERQAAARSTQQQQQ